MFKDKLYNSKRQIRQLSQKKSLSKNSSFRQRNLFRNSNSKNKSNKIKIIPIRKKILDNKVNDCLKEYSIFKSKIYLKEKKEKENKINDILQNSVIKHLVRNLNYSNIIQLIDIGINKYNPFKTYNVKNKINEIENMNKSINKNKIDINLAKKVLHDIKIKSRVDSGIKKDYNFDKIYQKIENCKLQFVKKINQRTKLSNLNNSYSIRYYRNKEKNEIKKNNSAFIRIKDDKTNNYNNMNSEKTINSVSASINHIENLKMKIVRSKSSKKLSDKNFHIDDNSKILRNRNKSFRNKRIISNEKIFSKNTTASESMNCSKGFRSASKFKFRFTQLNKTNNSRSKIEIFNPKKISNRTILNSKMSKPNFATTIQQIYKDFRKIKSNSIKLKSKYKEWGFSSYKKIDDLIKVKEDMLLFHLKQKFLKNVNLFPKDKNKKIIDKNQSVINKIIKDIDLYDDHELLFEKKKLLK